MGKAHAKRQLSWFAKCFSPTQSHKQGVVRQPQRRARAGEWAGMSR